MNSNYKIQELPHIDFSKTTIDTPIHPNAFELSDNEKISKIAHHFEDIMHPLYQFLTEKSQNKIDDFDIEWNFQKFLINENGTIDKVISPRILPNAPEIVDWIKK